MEVLAAVVVPLVDHHLADIGVQMRVELGGVLGVPLPQPHHQAALAEHAVSGRHQNLNNTPELDQILAAAFYCCHYFLCGLAVVDKVAIDSFVLI